MTVASTQYSPKISPTIVFGIDGKVDPFLALAEGCRNIAKNFVTTLTCFVALTVFTTLLCFAALPLEQAIPSCRGTDCVQAYYRYFTLYFFPNPYLAIGSAVALFLIWIAYKKIILTSALVGGRTISYKIIKKITAYQLFKMLMLYILLMGTYCVGIFLMVVPFFVFYIRYIFSENLVLDSHSGALLAPRISRLITAGNRPEIALCVIIPAVLATVACYFIWKSTLQFSVAFTLTVAVISLMRIMVAAILAVVYAGIAEVVRGR